MWIIAGTLPDADLPLTLARVEVQGHSLLLHRMEDALADAVPPAVPVERGGAVSVERDAAVPVERGTAALAAAAWHCCRRLNVEPPLLLVAGDQGNGAGSRAVYAYLVEHLARLRPLGLTFHYLFPDVDWHNRVLMAVEALEQRPLLVADAGFMYVAKMSGYADSYDLFTPDIGEMAFLADEKAPHPFYTRGFLLEHEENVPALLARAREHGNVARHLIIKGSTDHVAAPHGIFATVSEPGVPAMEAIGGTGDLVTGLATGFLCGGLPVDQASLMAVKTNRQVAVLAHPTPATQLAELVEVLPRAL